MNYPLLHLFRYTGSFVLPRMYTPDIKDEMTINYATEMRNGEREYFLEIPGRIVDPESLLSFVEIFGEVTEWGIDKNGTTITVIGGE